MLVRTYSVFCDAEGCGRWVGEAVEAKDIRRTARRRGWKRVTRPGGPRGRGADYCPQHAGLHST